MIPSQWITIGSDILTVIISAMGTVDLIWHTALLTNPITLTVLAILGALGIHQTVVTNQKLKK